MRAWAARLRASGLSAFSVRKAVFALRRAGFRRNWWLPAVTAARLDGPPRRPLLKA